MEEVLVEWTKRLRFSPDLASLEAFLDFLQTESPPLSLVNSVFQSEGISGLHASSFFLRFLKKDDLIDVASAIIQQLTPIDVLCGSSVERKIQLDFEKFPITIFTGNQETAGLGFKVWPAAERLISLMAEKNFPIQNRRLVELGAGLGVCGIYARKFLGASDVIATDFNAELLEICARNFRENAVRDFRTRFLDWAAVGISDHLEDLRASEKEQISVLIGSDVVYYPEHAEILHACISYFLREQISDSCLLTLSGQRPGVAEFVALVENTEIFHSEISVFNGITQIYISLALSFSRVLNSKGGFLKKLKLKETRNVRDCLSWRYVDLREVRESESATFLEISNKRFPGFLDSCEELVKLGLGGSVHGTGRGKKMASENHPDEYVMNKGVVVVGVCDDNRKFVNEFFRRKENQRPRNSVERTYRRFSWI